MKNKKAIVTMAIGEERYMANWKTYCEPNWRPYADKFGFDLICLNDPLDDSERAKESLAVMAEMPDSRAGICALRNNRVDRLRYHLQ